MPHIRVVLAAPATLKRVEADSRVSGFGFKGSYKFAVQRVQGTVQGLMMAPGYGRQQRQPAARTAAPLQLSAECLLREATADRLRGERHHWPPRGRRLRETNECHVIIGGEVWTGKFAVWRYPVMMGSDMEVCKGRLSTSDTGPLESCAETECRDDCRKTLTVLGGLVLLAACRDFVGHLETVGFRV